jgi:hypothetical protein
MIESLTIFKELGVPILGIIGMLIVYTVTIQRFKRDINEFKQEIRHDINEFKQEIGDISNDLRKLSLDVLQLKITNKELPSYARIAAYDEYKRKGGNSWIDVYVKEEGLLNL